MVETTSTNITLCYYDESPCVSQQIDVMRRKLAMVALIGIICTSCLLKEVACCWIHAVIGVVAPG
jgi:hypothetical protein